MRSAIGQALACVALCVPACAHFRPDPPARPLPAARQVLFVADGAGDYRVCSTTMRQTARDDGLPLEVNTFVWSHGYLRSVADHTDFGHARARGRDLAGRVLARQHARPDLPISLVGHSAGSGVVLSAAEHLPPNTLERVILFAPSVSSDYDLRPTLLAARQGVDLFYSPEDQFFLGTVTDVIGAMDDAAATRTAGRFGFEPPPHAADAVLYAKLRQYRWNPTLLPTGHDGGHYGAYQAGHLRRFVFPLLMN